MNVNGGVASPASAVAAPGLVDDKTTETAIRRRNNKRKPNYAQLHKDVLPLTVFPLPVFHPTQPLSLLQLLWTITQQLITRPRSHPGKKYVGHFSAETRSVHVTNHDDVRALWERGFFGKGTLSRSEPSWMDREKARLAARSQGGQTAEEATKARREERRLFKLERARLERERIDQQRLVEQGKLVLDQDQLTADLATSQQTGPSEGAQQLAPSPAPHTAGQIVVPHEADELAGEEADIHNQEHLQLALEEAFFLSFALGVLDIRNAVPDGSSDRDIFDLFRGMSAFGTGPRIAMDDRFIVNYVVYHHFRSLGWVIRPGVKFSVDYLLYNRGPVFSHAEFAVLIMPSYSHPYWSTTAGISQRKLVEQRAWWWLHCINRVQSQVKKTLVLCYVDIPPPPDRMISVKALLSRYKIREFVMRRWLMNRSRD